MNRVTLDSNILVSGLVFQGNPHRILELAAEGAFEVAVSDVILDEVHRVLRLKFQWTPEEAGEGLEAIRAFAIRVAPTETIRAVRRDVDDNAVLECAVSAGSEIIVSGDNDLLSLGSFRGIKIQRAADFLVESGQR